jgi:cell fate regulator YaaT (PSP1 superfamily)
MCGVKSATPKGCQNNGTCGTGGCNMMNSFDWLSDMLLPDTLRFDMVEVRFKGGRKEFYRNSEMLELYTGDMVVVEAQTGYHIGTVSLQGELVRLQMQRKKIALDGEQKLILRKPTEKDKAIYEQATNREAATIYRGREIIKSLGLGMKLSDVEFQADETKATFYYSAEGRVDFRELIKLLAAEFRVRIEMRQISLRQEAGRIGGIGACGRELCCSTWLSDFKNVTTAAARYQNLSLNPAKLSGQCGRLKCCLNYELETYLDALVDIPKVEQPLLTTKGKATLQKVDIFKKILWFAYNQESTWHPLSPQRVTAILEANSKGIPVMALNDETDVIAKPTVSEEINFQTKPRDKDRRPGQKPASKNQEKPAFRPENRPAESRPKPKNIPAKNTPANSPKPEKTGTNPQSGDGSKNPNHRKKFHNSRRPNTDKPII